MTGAFLARFKAWDAEARAHPGPGAEVLCKAPDGRVLAAWRCPVDHQHTLMGEPLGHGCSIPSEQATYFEAAIGEGRCPFGHGALTGSPPRGSGGHCEECSGWWCTWVREHGPTWEFSFTTGPIPVRVTP